MTELESYRQWMHPAHEFAPKMRTLADCVETGTPTKGNEFVITTVEPKPISSELLESVRVSTGADPLYHFADAINRYPEIKDKMTRDWNDWVKRSESMTLERAVEVLNEHSYDTGGWEVMEHGKFATNVDKTYDEFEAIAIAEKLLRESE